MLDAKVLVVPSVVTADGDRDGIPVALAGAVVRGVPVVASRISGVSEALDDAGGAAGRGRWARQRILSTYTPEHQVDAAVVLTSGANPRP